MTFSVHRYFSLVEKRKAIMVPVVWVIRNAYKHGLFEYKDIRKEFECREAFWEAFPETDPEETDNQVPIARTNP